MTSKRLFALLLLVLTSLQFTAHAQYYRKENNIWYFGTKIGLDFNSGTPRAYVSNAIPSGNPPFIGEEGCATVSNASGQLLFHTNGDVVWDSTGAFMPNGRDITKNPGNKISSTAQGAVVAPIPDSPGKYFIFSMPESWTPAIAGNLYCNKIDMSLNGGKGDIDTTFPLRYKVLDTGLTQRMVVAPSFDCGYTWLLVYRRSETMFRAYKITKNGLDLNPVISNIGTLPIRNYILGLLKVSPNGRKIVSTSGVAGAELYDFDPATGIVSNALKIDSIASSSYGCAFSPDNSKLYIGHFYQQTGKISQFDLSQPTNTDILRSRKIVG